VKNLYILSGFYNNIYINLVIIIESNIYNIQELSLTELINLVSDNKKIKYDITY